MKNKFEEEYLSKKERIYDGISVENTPAIIPRLKELKQLADKSEVWALRVEARRSMIKLSYEMDFLEQMMAELIWLVGQWEMNQEDAELEDGMILLERFIAYLPAFPKVARSDINKAIETLKAWFATTSREPQHLAWALFRTYKNLGEKAAAEKYRQQLIQLEQQNPFRFTDVLTSCSTCIQCIQIHYFVSLGRLDKAMELAQPLLEVDVQPCMTSPRTGLAILLDALLEAGRISDAKQLIPGLRMHIDIPYKAPLRVMVPLLRYYQEVGEQELAQDIIDRYASMAETLADRLTAERFYCMSSEE